MIQDVKLHLEAVVSQRNDLLVTVEELESSFDADSINVSRDPNVLDSPLANSIEQAENSLIDLSLPVDGMPISNQNEVRHIFLLKQMKDY